MLAFVKQPLLHFFLVAALIFLIFSYWHEEKIVSDNNAIIVDRETLLNFLQYRANAFQPEIFSQRLNNMDQDSLNTLVEDFVREEAFYREALKMGMENGDYIIRQRLVQKVEFLLQTLISKNIKPSEIELAEFYNERVEDYTAAAVYTFTHIFFDAEQHGWNESQQMAKQKLIESDDILFNDASLHGDRFPFLLNYVERNRDFVVANFNADFADNLDLIDLEQSQWLGPFRSNYGHHLVLLTQRSDSFVPSMESIRTRVEEDYLYELSLKNMQKAEQTVIADYTVNLNL